MQQQVGALSVVDSDRGEWDENSIDYICQWQVGRDDRLKIILHNRSTGSDGRAMGLSPLLTHVSI